MNLQQHPELVDKLAAAYALGTLRGGARRRFETLARQSPVTVSLNMRSELSGSETQLAQLQTQGRDLARQNTQLVAQLQAQPEIRYVSVLHDDKATPTMLVTFDPKHNTLTLKRVGGAQEGPDKSLQLWALPAGGAPRSLGVLGTEPVLRLAAAEQVVGQVPALAISLEPLGGVPGEGGPTGPVIYKGAVLQTPL